ncbi:MAG: hypothetical protein DSM106950_04940 [Stigonema ocellatum SAG 48.90 = DSM 106950]|nr:hypothetical protein [Stigonema ocellatum SAG 48.90 = DSM 106950]
MCYKLQPKASATRLANCSGLKGLAIAAFILIDAQLDALGHIYRSNP